MMTPPDIRESVAYHEAAHAVLVHLCGYRVQSVTIRRTQEHEGMCVWLAPEKHRRQDWLQRAMIAVAGTLMECVEWGGAYDAEHDLEDARRAIRKAVRRDTWSLDGQGARSETFRSICQETRNLLQLPKTRIAVYALAGALLRRETLEGEAAHRMIQDAWK